MTTFGLRISCPDRPGRLGAITTALGGAGVNIVSLDVIERRDGYAVDQLVVEAPPVGLERLVEVVEVVPDVVVELVHAIPASRSELAPLDLAADLLTSTDDVILTLVNGVAAAYDAVWAVVLRERTPQPEVLVASQGAPSFVGAGTPWLPASSCRRLLPGPWTPPHWTVDPLAGSFALVPLAETDAALLVARTRGPVFRAKELGELEQLGTIAARAAALRLGAVPGLVGVGGAAEGS